MPRINGVAMRSHCQIFRRRHTASRTRYRRRRVDTNAYTAITTIPTTHTRAAIKVKTRAGLTLFSSVGGMVSDSTGLITLSTMGTPLSMTGVS